MKTENAKPRRVRMNYKVSELHHLFFNRSLPEGAGAGSMAAYGNGVLWHDKHEPAAAFLTDARANDGRPAAVIMPPSISSRWTRRELEQAAPPAVALVVLPNAWPAIGAKWDTSPLNIYTGDRATSAAALCAAYTLAIDSVCAGSAHSARDAVGQEPENVPAFALAVRALLALSWSDAGARESARASLENVLNAWQLSSGGAYHKETVQAISQRRFIEKEAAVNLPFLREYVATRAAALKDKTGRARLVALLELSKQYGRTLPAAIAAVLRAGLPPAATHGIPENLAGMLAGDSEQVARANKYLSGKRALPALWRGGGTMFAHDSDFSGYPRWVAESAAACLEHAKKQRRRASNKEHITRAREIVAGLIEQAPAIIAAAATIEKGKPDYPLIMEAEENDGYCYQAISRARDIERAGEISGFKDRSVMWPLDVPPVNIEHAGRLVASEANAYREREKWNIKAATMRAALPAVMESAAATPRAALSKLENTRHALRGWDWNAAPLALKNELIAECTAAIDSLYPLRDSISELDEYQNGGAAPAAGDWLLIKGREAVTTQGARVPARAIAAAFRFIDSQPAGAFDCRAAGFKIGNYQLNGRNDAGAVIVGCHTFSAASVEHIRGQVSAIDAAAVEVEAVARMS